MYRWTENTAYNIIIDKEFAADTAGRKIPRNRYLSFRTKKETEYGLVRLRLLNLDLTKIPVLQFVQSDGVEFSPIRDQHAISMRELFEPGEYDLRILYDENKNGKWDPGSFFKNRTATGKSTAHRPKAKRKG